MKTKYTPGPWEWQKDYEYTNATDQNIKEGRVNLVGPDRNHVLTSWYGDGDHGIDISIPNARLIKIAPELLETAEKMLVEIRRDIGSGPAIAHPCIVHGMIRLEAVIKRARGE